MEVIHVSAECYPVAKAGGLGDVVGALPKYQNKLGAVSMVLMPMYRTKFLYENEWELVHEDGAHLGNSWFRYSIIKEKTDKLGFELYLLDIDGLLDREKIYGYGDDTERFVSFQIAALHWINQRKTMPDVVHCHDYHTGLIPFMIKYCHWLHGMRGVRTVITIHNAQYQGWMDWDKIIYIPEYDDWKMGMLDWGGRINPLASGIKCADMVTTVSESYLEELRQSANGLENLFEYERGKCVGILNGIDFDFWDPEKDDLLFENYSIETVNEGKEANKIEVCKIFGLDPKNPLFIFIGRLVGEKAAEILPTVISESILMHDKKISMLVLGSGETHIEHQLQSMVEYFAGNYNCYIGYNEKLAHQLYAAADFLMMPSRVEPCGLNQMYALRYGTVPMVRKTGGLKDTVIDIGEPDDAGYGITFVHPTIGDLNHAIARAIGWYTESAKTLDAARTKMMAIDNSWEKSAEKYLEIYQ